MRRGLFGEVCIENVQAFLFFAGEGGENEDGIFAVFSSRLQLGYRFFFPSILLYENHGFKNFQVHKNHGFKIFLTSNNHGFNYNNHLQKQTILYFIT